MDEFEKVKRRIEAEDGKPLEPGDEIVCRAVHGFIRGVQLRNQLESQPTSGPVHISVIVKERFAEILADADRRRRQIGVVEAVKEFLAGKSKPNKQHRAEQKTEQGQLYGGRDEI